MNVRTGSTDWQASGELDRQCLNAGDERPRVIYLGPFVGRHQPTPSQAVIT